MLNSLFNQPTKLNESQFVRHPDAVGIPADFEVFEPTPKYEGVAQPAAVTYEAIEPATKMAMAPFPIQLKNLIFHLWQGAQVSEGALRSNVVVGHQRANVYHGASLAIRGAPVQVEAGPYQPRPQVPNVAPIGSSVKGPFINRSPLPTDWPLMNEMLRIDAYTFRGDRRGPATILDGGFKPSSMRNDESFLKGDVYRFFKDYLKRRYDMDLPAHVTPDYFFNLVRETYPTAGDRETLVHYFMWRKICEKEKLHLGRMTGDECLKHYISTTRFLGTAIDFATRAGTDGWIYVTLVRGGYVVPLAGPNFGNHPWGQKEHEIAKLGGIPGDDIVGFRHYDYATKALDGPVYFRRSFRKSESKAFNKAYKILCGKPQKAMKLRNG